MTYNGQTTAMKANVLPYQNFLMPDTAQHTLALGQSYTIGAFLKDENGNALTDAQVSELIEQDKLNVRDSRVGYSGFEAGFGWAVPSDYEEQVMALIKSFSYSLAKQASRLTSYKTTCSKKSSRI